MAALVVQSRFAGLKIEDDDYPSSSDGSKTKKPKQAVKKAEPPKKTAAKTNNNANKTQSAGKKKKAKQTGSNVEQWETWKQKDEALVDGNFETELQQAEDFLERCDNDGVIPFISIWKIRRTEREDCEKEMALYKKRRVYPLEAILHRHAALFQTEKSCPKEIAIAILLSKLDYEEKKDVYKQMKKDAEVEKKQAEQAKNSKKKKKNVMSLDQFNDMINPEPNYQHENEKHTTEEKTLDRDTEFFERIKDETKNELLKDKIIDRVRNRPQVSDEIITRSQFAEALEKKDKQIAAMKEEIISLKEELLTVKSRNKKLCSILGQGEMKDKAEVLIEVERLRGVQAELTAELEALHRDLQRERSRQEPRHPAKKKKNGDKEK